ncbi:MAG: peptidylprolyl isomerase [Bacteroidales bacterium]|nr:peptidylprolyl isomerase [Bacteroidales bacterium]
MKKFRIVLFLSFLIVVYSSHTVAQVSDNRVLLTIAGDDITAGEFMYVYQKNNLFHENPDPAALREYLDLYINFRLKVREAEELGMDTISSFRRELEGYRKQLAQPYFTDQSVSEQLLHEAYERKKLDVRGSHILFRIERNAAPKDTLAAYQLAMKAYDRIKNGEDFGIVAYEASEDPSARDTEGNQFRPARKGNLGDLGYFTVFDMVYPFENGAYNTEPGKVSLPVRTDFGYHLIKVTDKQPALGQAQVAHIFVQVPPNTTTEDSIQKKAKIEAAYAKINSGVAFEDVVLEFSEDKSSAANGGKLPWFGSNRMVPEFIIATRNLEEIGGVSDPFTSPFGWHIIKLIDRKPVGTFEEEQFNIKSRLEKDIRNKLSEKAVINRIKEEYHFKEHPKTLDAVIAVLDSTLMQAEWDVSKAKGLDKTVFSLGDSKYTQQDLVEYIAAKQNKRITDIRQFFNESYENFVFEKCLAIEDSKLEEKYPDFRMLVREYHDGILLFDLTDKNVWSKAVRDTLGLKEFYEANRGNYMWDKRLHASIVTILNPGVVKSDNVRKMFTSGKSTLEILEAFNTDTTLNILIETSRYSEGESTVIDGIKWKTGLSPMVDSPDGPSFAYVYEILIPEPRTLDEARGLITADYQAFLEERWIRELRAKYPVIIHEEVLSTLK